MGYVEEIFYGGENAHGNGMLGPTRLSFEVSHPFRCTFARRLAPSGDEFKSSG